MAAAEGVTEERLERALVTLAYIITRHGAVYAPLFDRLEKELAIFRAQLDPVSKAKKFLDTYTVDGNTLKAIR